MPKRYLLLAVVTGLCLVAGCDLKDFSFGFDKDDEGLAPDVDDDGGMPPSIRGTVAEYAGLVESGGLLVDGHGLVVGLGKAGSHEVPPRLKKHLVEYMLKQRVGSALGAAEGVTPSQMIADPDTAVVRLVAAIPPGAPEGWRFDVRVNAISRTGTRSLVGGILYPFPLYMATGEGVPPTSGARAWAVADGSVFVNPFLDPNRPADRSRMREGRLIGGGRVLRSRPIRLLLREPDYARCNLIQQRINQRFGQPEKVANAKNPATIDLTVPPRYRHEYARFLQLVLHLPLQVAPGRWEARAREMVEELSEPGADHDGLALVLEAMGPQVIDTVRTQYASKNPAAAFYAARTGLRLRDDLAAEVLIRFARTTNSPYQVPAIEELGGHSWIAKSITPLRELVGARSRLVRIAAYEALSKLSDSATILRTSVGTEFDLDAVRSRRSYVIYATQNLVRRIVLFGRDMTVARDVFFDMPDGSLTMVDKEVAIGEDGQVVPDPSKLSPLKRMKLKKDRRLMLFRSIPRTGGISEPFYVNYSVRELVATMGAPAARGRDGRIEGLGLTYGQVISCLYRMCEVDKCIPARFVLQAPPGRERIYRDAPTMGRPDMPPE